MKSRAENRMRIHHLVPFIIYNLAQQRMLFTKEVLRNENEKVLLNGVEYKAMFSKCTSCYPANFSDLNINLS
jgi:hypothetical protein